MAKVQLEAIRKVYDNGQVVVPGVSFEVADGELMVLVGPSGCGKSTLLRMIAGLEDISSGTLRIGERVVNNVPPKDRNVAMVFQSYALYPHMTAAENLAFGLKLRGYSTEAIAERIKNVAEMLGLTSLLDTLPKAMSGGQRQRVALGRAMVRESAVFLLDEPLSNLDAKLRNSVRSDITRLHRKLGTTMIYVTHDQVEAMTLGHRIVLLKDGVIQQIDTPMVLYDHPANLFVAGFLGNPAMNMLSGRLEVVAGGMELHLVSGERVMFAGAIPKSVWFGRDVVLGYVRSTYVRRVLVNQWHWRRLSKLWSQSVMRFLHLRCGALALILRVPPQELPGIGESLPLAVQPDRLHLFDAVSGECLAGH